jgi:hypothetical protein
MSRAGASADWILAHRMAYLLLNCFVTPVLLNPAVAEAESFQQPFDVQGVYQVLHRD